MAAGNEPKCEVMKEALTTFYSDLLEILPIEYLVKHLYSDKLLSGDKKRSLEGLSECSKKIQYFLDCVLIPAVNIGYTNIFEKMLHLMERGDDEPVKFLAEKIKQFLLERDISLAPPIVSG